MERIESNLCVLSSAIQGVDPDGELVQGGCSKSRRAGKSRRLLVTALNNPIYRNPTQVLQEALFITIIYIKRRKS